MNTPKTVKRQDQIQIKAVILDWAGTTVDYGSFAPTTVFIRLFEEQGIAITPEDARIGMGLMKRDHLKKILSLQHIQSTWMEKYGAAPSEADADRLFSQFIPMQLSLLAQFAQPIPGLLPVIEELRKRDIKIGSTTGYTREMMDVLAPKAKEYGYEPDCIVCPDEVPAGRPYPWMCYQNAMKLGVFPMQAMVKVGDTTVDIEEGLNAGMWSVGVSLTGNIIGGSESEINSMAEEMRQELRLNAKSQLLKAGAHYVIDGIWDLPTVLNDILMAISFGDQP